MQRIAHITRVSTQGLSSISEVICVDSQAINCWIWSELAVNPSLGIFNGIGSWTYTYDYNNIMIRVANSGVTKGQYFYDGDGERVKVIETDTKVCSCTVNSECTEGFDLAKYGQVAPLCALRIDMGISS